MTNLQELLRRVKNDEIISRLNLTNDQALKLIECRESNESSAEWASHSEFINAPDYATRLAHFEGIIDEIRELTYTQAFMRWQSPDVSAYVSDDFGIIAAALAMNLDDPWIVSLASHYIHGNIPECNVEPLHGNLIETLLLRAWGQN
jgi:hypothetical protein